MLFRQIDYSVELIGEDHVGLGFDCVRMDESLMKASIGSDRINWPKGYDAPNWGFAGAEVVPPLTELMLKKGYSKTTVRKILGENWMRICRTVWK
jgi:membrane dipeptidase